MARRTRDHVEIDRLDREILRQLQQDAALSNAELAKLVGLSPSPCWRRTRRLEEVGVIQKRVALLDPEALGLNTVVFASVRLSAQGQTSLPDFEAAVRNYPEVVECYTTSGGVDFLLRVVTRDMRDYEDFLRNHLLQMPAVQEVHSRIAITQVKYTTALPLELTAG
ncbi:MAG: Lrp/AsnC family transcriptional regulator [bacterium]|nr:Lrp/AsnC family transcriptional regulator [bacterium]MCP5065423.1 Lrp/AsnC family transcriptional regulator [bacterium]